MPRCLDLTSLVREGVVRGAEAQEAVEAGQAAAGALPLSFMQATMMS